MLIKAFGLFFFLISFALLLFDSFYNPSSSLKYFFVDSRLLYYLFIFLHILASFKNLSFLPERFIKYNNYFLFPATAFFFISIAIINGFTYPEFAYNTFRLNLENFKYVFFISGFVLLVNVKAGWLKTYPQKLLYLGGILYFIAATFFNAFFPELFKELLQEDGMLENIQTVLYLAGAAGAFLAVSEFIKSSEKLKALFFLVLGIGLFFIAGEEISWGQRILGLETPEQLAEVNWQGELTLHNIGAFQSKIDYFYMLVGFWGSFLPIFLKKFLPKYFKKWQIFFPMPILFFYFFAVLRFYFLNQFVVFNYQLFSFEKVGIGYTQEAAETLLAFGFACFTILICKQLEKQKS